MPNVLVVDDDAVLRSAVVALLESRHLRVVEAESAADALQQSVLWSRIDLAIVDLQLNGEDGISIAERISADHPHSTIVCISASTPSAGQRRRMARFSFFSKDASLFGHLNALTTDA
jgi:CheY-like chemotaxis protein